VSVKDEWLCDRLDHGSFAKAESMLDVEEVRKAYPALNRLIGGKPIVYFDSAATGLKPQCVIDSVTKCYVSGLGNVGRGVHLLSQEAMDAYERARRSVADFINADPDEIVFTRNATEAINLVAASLPEKGSVMVGESEHHSNFLPWRVRHNVITVAIDDVGCIDVSDFRKQISSGTNALCAVSHVSNALGTIQPVQELVELAKLNKVPILIDASQAVGHFPVDMGSLGAQFLCFSGHKLGGPSGIGVLYARRGTQNLLRPINFGGGMVEHVSASEFSLTDFPNRLEAGTPAIEAAVGLAAACDFLDRHGLDSIREHERALTCHAMKGLVAIPRVTVVGPKAHEERGPIVAFFVEGIEAHGLARMLSSRFNIMVRSGFHCSQPLHQRLELRPTVRASFSLYNTACEVDYFIESIRILADY
jgi:cysteine desulfurase / selenocysteine lyase